VKKPSPKRHKKALSKQPPRSEEKGDRGRSDQKTETTRTACDVGNLLEGGSRGANLKWERKDGGEGGKIRM